MTTDITELALIAKIKKQLENFDTVVLKEDEANALVEALEKAQRAGSINNQWKPDVCPITGRRFFMWIEHPELGYVPTYGGPYDSYTIPTRDGDGEFSCERYDHDFGGWVEGECVGAYLINDDEHCRVYELEQRIAELESRTAMLASSPQSPGSDSATVPTKWIPVSERMPEKNQSVLISVNFDSSLVEPLICSARYTGSTFRRGDATVKPGSGIEQATHWTPLPAAPQEVKS